MGAPARAICSGSRRPLWLDPPGAGGPTAAVGRRDTRRKRARERAPDRARWREKTDAELLAPGELVGRKAAAGWHLLGVVGFAGRWRGPAAAREEDARRLLEREFVAARERHGASLVIVSGATNSGVLNLTYAACERLGITAMGITAGQALAYSLAPMQYVIPVGQRFGDESPLFVESIDALVMLGGGAQSRREALAASGRGIPITVIQGFGGAADELTAEELPRARWVSL